MSADSGDRLPEGDEMDELSSALPVQLSLRASEGLTQRESGRIADATPPEERLSFDVGFSERPFPEIPPGRIPLLASEGLVQRESERIADATPPVERLSFDGGFSERTFPEGPQVQVDEGVLRYGGPFPVFLNDPSIAQKSYEEGRRVAF
jgi:hypothetical protein